MFFILLGLFVVIPLIELALLIEIGKQIGVFSTIMVVILTGVLGAYLTRSQGFQILFQIRSQFQQGQFPADSLLEGLLILIGGLTLLTPGFITDAFGFLCLLPPTRVIFRELIKREIRRRMNRNNQINSDTWFRDEDDYF